MDHPAPNIDTLLERYLALLDEYTALRAELSRLQTATFQHLARANFAAERGVRFGQDYYDARMQAGRRVAVTAGASSRDGAGAGGGGGGDDDDDRGVAFEVVQARELAPDVDPTKLEKANVSVDDDNDEKTGAKKPTPPPKDPIRWFGLLTPPALRQTQASAIDAVERVVPRLVTVDAAMRQVEVEVRRARKRRAKAAKQEELKGHEAPRAEVAASLSFSPKVSG